MTRLWHPFADMSRVTERGELVLERGDGVRVVDEQGRTYLDATAGLWFCNVGFGREEIVEAAAAQLRTLPAYSSFGDLATRPALDLAERVAALAPVRDGVVFLTSGGGDAVDTAAKLARRFFSLRGESSRTVVLARERAYHGTNAFGTALAGSDVFSEGMRPLVGDVGRVPWDDAGALADTIGALGAERVAAFFCEPVIGAGGVYAPPPGYLEATRAICRDAGVLFVVDEVITGFGRLGQWFASGRYALDPDIVLFAKGVTSGYLPLGGLIVSGAVAEPFWQPGAGIWRHGHTYSGHATVAAAGLANLDILERERLAERALALEGALAEAIQPLAGHPLVAEVRAGTGLLAAVQLSADALREDPSLPDRAVAGAREAGVLTRALIGGALQVSPALVIEESELVELASGLAAALDACLARA
jgi:adenosylmethionine-8-amino-7-oxononanoate aminotransferase